MGRFADLDIAIAERVDRTEETPETAASAVLSSSRFIRPPGALSRREAAVLGRRIAAQYQRIVLGNID